jgi:putative flippase GtrA
LIKWQIFRCQVNQESDFTENSMFYLANKIQNLIIQVIDFFYTPFRKAIPRETFRYAATGGFNTCLDIFLYFVFYNFILDKQIVNFGLISVSPYIAAFLFVFPITFFTGFLFAKYITFTNSEIRGRIQLIRYLISVLGSIFLNYMFLKLLVEYGGLWPTLSKIITTGIVVVYSYFAQKFFTFKTTKFATY